MKNNKYLTIWTVLVFTVLLLPFCVMLYASFSNSALISVPLKSFGVKPYSEVFMKGKFVASTLLSLQVATYATAIALVVGTLASFVLVRKQHLRAVKIINYLLLAPLMIPMVITGIALMVTLNRMGVITGIALLVGVHSVIVVPYIIRSVTASLSNFDIAIEEASINLGAGPWRTIWEISLPNIRGGIITGGIFAFVSSFGEVVATPFLLPPGMMTLPVEILNILLYNFSTGIAAISTLVAVVVFLALWVVFLIFPSAFSQQ